jgi:hypothetical protein
VVIHKRNNLKGEQPLCWHGENRTETFMSHPDVMVVDCVDCLRMLAKDAVLFGNQRRARRDGR